MVEGIDFKRFGALNVVLVDKDPNSAQLSRTLLSSLGIYQLRIVESYEQFLRAMEQEPADVVAFDAGSKTDQEIDFIQQLRQESGDMALMPVLSFTADTTKQDVYRLVNAGATELVAKPSNVKALFSRLQNMVDSPRSFVATKDFKGPDRRRKQQPGVADESRTARSPQIVTREAFLSGDVDGPVVIQPDFSLKVKANNIVPGSIMRPAIEDEFIFWSLSDLAALEASQIAIADGAAIAPNVERISNACLSIMARSEAYGYDLGGQVASQLQSFSQQHFKAGKEGHLVVIEKHIQTLSLIYNGRLRGDGGDTGKALAHDLGLLVRKYAS